MYFALPTLLIWAPVDPVKPPDVPILDSTEGKRIADDKAGKTFSSIHSSSILSKAPSCSFFCTKHANHTLIFASPIQSEHPDLKIKLLDAHELPKWYPVMDGVLGMYRPPSLRLSYYVRSLSFKHNELVNIWSHIIGFILYTTIVSNYISAYRKTTTMEESDNNTAMSATIILDKDLPVLYAVFFFSAMNMLFCSSIAHTFYCKSQEYTLRCWQLDQIGVALSITADAAGSIYCVHYCNEDARNKLLAFLFISAFIAVFLMLREHSIDRRNQYLALYASVFWPGSIALGFNSDMYTSSSQFQSAMHHMLVAFIIIFSSFVAFAARFPERTKPGRYDFVGQSHQIWHLACVISSCYFAYALFKAYFGAREYCQNIDIQQLIESIERS